MFSVWHKTFNLDYALAGNRLAPLPGGEVRPHAQFAADVLFGLPGPFAWETFGSLWPIFGWWVGVILVVRGARHDRRVWALGTAGLLILLGHFGFFALYACPGGRFYLPAIFLCAGLFWYGLARLAAQPRVGLRAVACVLVVVAATGLARGMQRDWRFFADMSNPNSQELRNFEEWLALGDLERGRQGMAFEPLRVQALGYLNQDLVRRIHIWGRLPHSEHVQRLHAFGHLDERLEIAPAADRRFIHRSELTGTGPALVIAPPRFEPEVKPFFREGFESGQLDRWSVVTP
jgi:hypothetical protein